MLIAQLGVFLQRFRDHAFEVNRKVGNHACGSQRLAFQNRRKNYARCVSAERLTAGGHFVKHHAERKQIRARIQIFSADLLGRHVGDRADGSAWTGEVGVRVHGHAARRHRLTDVFRHQLGQTKIENFGLAALGDKNICGLDVAMDDAFGVRCFERVGNINTDFEQHIESHGLAIDAMLERGAL